MARLVVEAIIDAMERYDDPVPLNIGSGQETTIKELVELVAQEMGYKGLIRWQGDATMNGQPRRVLDTNRIFNELGWLPCTTLEEGIRKTVAWYKGLQ